MRTSRLRLAVTCATACGDWIARAAPSGRRSRGTGGATDHVVDGTTRFYGPFDPQVPDGSQIACWDTVSEQRTDSGTGAVYSQISGM